MKSWKSRYSGIIYVLIFFALSLVSANIFLDQNLMPRWGIFLFLVLLLIPVIQNDKLHWDEGILLLFYLYNLISCIWVAQQFDLAFLEAQRTGLYFISFFISRRIIERLGFNFLTQTAVSVAIVLVLVNFVVLFSSGAQVNTTGAHPNLLSSYLLLFLPFAIYSALSNLSKWRILSYLAIILMTVILAILQTRSVWIGLFILMIMLWYIYFRPKWSKKWNYLFLGVFGFLITALFLITIKLNLFDGTSLQERFFVWGKTLRLIGEAPFIGLGSGNWIIHYTKFGITGFDTFEYYGLVMKRPHNDILWVLAELGLVGVSILGLFFWSTLRKTFSAPSSFGKKVFLAGLVAFLPVVIFSFPKERVEHIFLFFTIMAVLTSFSKEGIPVILNRGGRIAMGVTVILSMAVVFYNAKGQYYNNQMLTAMHEKQPRKVINFAEQATSVFYQHSPQGRPIASFKAWAYEQLGQKDSLYYYSQKAYFRAPFNYEVLTNFGVALNAVKDFDKAERLLLEAHRINARYDGAIFNLAIVYYNQEEYKKAKTWIDRVNYKSEKTDYYSGLIHKKLEVK